MKTMLLCALLFCALTLMANPAPLRVFSEFWFDVDGDMYIELSYNQYGPLTNARLRLTDIWDNVAYMDSIYIPSQYEAIYLNLSQAFPDLILSRWYGELTIELESEDGEFISVGDVAWGSSLYPSIGLSYVSVYDLDLTSGWSYYIWVIDTPPTPGLMPYHTIARASLTVSCNDQFGNPVPNAAVWVMSNSANSGHTNTEGVFTTDCSCRPILITVSHPQTNEQVYRQVHSFVPSTQVNLTVTMNVTSNDADPPLPDTPIKGFEVYPNPFFGKQHKQVSLIFDGDHRVLSGAETVVYNLRGQEISRIPMQTQVENIWVPDSRLPSGVYMLKLINGNKMYGVKSIRIFK